MANVVSHVQVEVEMAATGIPQLLFIQAQQVCVSTPCIVAVITDPWTAEQIEAATIATHGSSVDSECCEQLLCFSLSTV